MANSTKSRESKIRRQRARRRLADWRAKNRPEQLTAVPVEIVGVTGKLPTAHQ